MTKNELIDAIADDTDISKDKAREVLAAIFENIIKGVSKNGEVQLIGFGCFKSAKRAAREGRNPATGEKLKIAASKTVKFAAGKAFKESVNKAKK